jgi:hypothetical protein
VPGDVAVWAERFEEAEVLFEKLLRHSESRSEPFGVFHAAFSWTDGLCRLGRLAEADSLSEKVFEVAEVAPVVLPFALAARALVLLEEGHLEEARDWCEQLACLARGHRWFLVRGYDLHRRGTLAWRGGDVETACSMFRRMEELASGWGLRDPSAIPWAADAISAHLASNRISDAERVVEWLSPAAVLPSRWPRVVMLRGRAALAERSGDLEWAHQLFEEAVSLQVGMPLPLACAETLTSLEHSSSVRGTSNVHGQFWLKRCESRNSMERSGTPREHAPSGAAPAAAPARSPRAN